MKKQRVVILDGSNYVWDIEAKINPLLDEWRIVSVTAQHVATGSSTSGKYGCFLILLEKEV